MKKTTKTMTLATSLLIATQGVNVQAQEQVTPTPEAQKETQVTTAADVSAITQEADQAKAAVQAQKEVLSTAQSHYDQANQELTEANQAVTTAEKELAAATPEKKAELEAALAKAQDDLLTQEAAIRQGLTDKDQTKGELLAQEEVVRKTGDELTQAQKVVEQASQAVALAQANLDGTGADQVLAEEQAATASLSQAQTDLEQAKSTLAATQAADKAHLEAVEIGELEVAQITQRLTDQQARLSQATKEEDKAKSDLEQAKLALEVAKAEHDALNTIVLLPDYVTNLKTYAAGGYISAASQEAERRLKALNAQQLALNTYKPNPNEDKVKLNPSQLDQATRQELTLFAVDLINQIRRQMGTVETLVNVSTIELANRIAKRYEADNWDWKKVTTISGHHMEVLKTEAAAAGLKASGHYENIHTIGTMYQPITSLTLSELKQKVHQAVMNYMFNGQEYFHAMSVAAVPGYGQPSRYLGVSFSNRSDAFGIHFIGVDEAAILDVERFDKTANLVPEKTADDVINTYAAAQTLWSERQNSHQAAQTDKELAELVTRQTSSQLATAKQSLTQLKQIPLQVPPAQLAVTKAEDNLVQAQTRLTLAQESKANLTADVATKTRLLDDAKTTYSKAKEHLTDRQTTVTAELEKLATAQANLANQATKLTQLEVSKTAIQDRINQLGKELERLEQTPNRLKVAKDRQAVLVALVAERRQVLDEAVAKLKSLEESSHKLEVQRATVLAAYQAFLASQTSLREELSKQQETPKASLQAPYIAQPIAAFAYGQVAGQGYGQRPVGQKALPNTGSKTSFGLVYSGMLTLMGLLGLRKKRKH